MKIHAYRVLQVGSLSLGDLLRALTTQTLGERHRVIYGAGIRLDEIQEHGGRWYLDFGGIRHEGPGRASAEDPITDFDLEDHEGFAHETAAIYDISTGIVGLQYNHYGPRINRIRSYLFQLASQHGASSEINGFGFNAIL